MKANIQKREIPDGMRVICVSDIHGSLDLFKVLLAKVGYDSMRDILVLNGDLYTKGNQCHECLQYIIELDKNPLVWALRGNCDWIEDYISDGERDWLRGLPHIIETQDYIFVHGGLPNGNMAELDAHAYMKCDNFMERGLKFDKYVITGHWPTINYCREEPCNNPIVNEESKIISIDGGEVIQRFGQLNAFIIEDGAFSFIAADNFPTVKVRQAQEKHGGFNITWNDRFIERLDNDVADSEIGLYRHLASGRELLLANKYIWTDDEGRLCGCGGLASDYFPALSVGEAVSLCERFSDRSIIKKDGTLGWAMNSVLALT